MIDGIIIGAGAAGLMCAREAGERGRSVLVLEGNTSIGEKIRISGGGRCNFTNLHTSPENFLSSNPRFCTSALARYAPDDFIKLIRQYRISYHEKVHGQLFCDGNAKQIIEMLHHECTTRGVEIKTGCRIHEIEKNDHFCVTTSQGEYGSKKLVIATGGLSIPSLGATDFGYRAAKKFSMNIIAPRPGLVPLLLDDSERGLCRALTGVSIEVKVTCGHAVFVDDLLFTHLGISGPAILQISSYWDPGKEIIIDFLPDINIEKEFELYRQSRKEIKTVLNSFLPKRFVEAWCVKNSIPQMIQQASKVELHKISQQLHQWTLHPVGTEGFSKAEVTVGGVDTEELSSKTMESKKISGLYCIGEVVDVTGHLGGFNFQWAWASGAAAGRSL